MVPSRLVLMRAERANERLGHENLGFLSGSHGFMPRSPPRTRLPPTHAQWDRIADDLPRLYRNLTLRSRLDALPVLPADSHQLPDAYLLRAATVLGVLAHAYHYVSVRPPQRLPVSVAVPWAEVLGRLGRRHPVLSYSDLIVHNWRLVDPSATPAMRVANLRLLVPTVDNREERVFYLTQTEILARCTPVVTAVVGAQEACAARDPGALEHHLLVVRDTLTEVTARSLPTISPVPTSPTHVDAAVWARTVAPFAVPFVADVPGPSGTSSPVFPLLDGLLDRARHESFLGREILQLRRTYPPNWQRFLAAVDELSVPDHVARHGGKAVQQALDEVAGAYSGDDGFLGRHRRKVIGYLDTAFKVGRGVTIGGFRGAFTDRTWEEIDDELDRARRERPSGPPGTAPLPARRPAPTPGGRVVPVSELVCHNDTSHGFWLAIDGHVYDVTAFVGIHPGGTRILQAYAGTDATGPFRRVHGTDRSVIARRDRYGIGRLVGPPAADGAATAWVRLLLMVVEMQNALRQDFALQRAVTTAGEAAGAVTPYKLERGLDSFDRFVRGYAAPLGRHHVPALAGVPSAGEDPGSTAALAADLVARVDVFLAGHPGPQAPDLAFEVRRLEQVAEGFLVEVKAALRAGVVGFERREGSDGAAVRAARAGLTAAFTGLVDRLPEPTGPRAG